MISTQKTYSKNQSFSSTELATWIAISSFGMLFGTFLLSFMLAKVRFPVWPPVGVEPVPMAIPAISTLLLFVSSLLVERALGFRKKGELLKFKKIWFNAIFLGLCFLVSQVLLWSKLIDQGLTLNDHLYGGAVYALTGLHALHVLAGLGLLIWIFFKAQSLEIKSEAPKMVALFWHFLDVVWFLMFLLIVVF
jgi:cytochrome c oxidase subunit 3